MQLVNVSSAQHHVGEGEIGPCTMGLQDRFLQVLVWCDGISKVCYSYTWFNFGAR